MYGSSAIFMASPRSLRGELRDRVHVGLVDKGRAGQYGLLAAAAVVAVRLVEPERVDRQVALEVGLLVDGELDGALLDGGDEVRVEVEGGDLGLAARVGQRLHGRQREGGAEGDDLVDGLV